MSSIAEQPVMNLHDDDASDCESVDDVPKPETTPAEAPNRYEKLERLKREKRLAMNRECARARRRRKKLRMELLENRVQELTQKNTKVQDANDALRARVAQLEAELGVAKSGMAMSLSSPEGMPSGPPASLLGPRMAGLSAEATQAMIAEKLNMQRRAALAGFGSGSGFGGLGGASGGSSQGLSGLGGGNAGPGPDQAAALRYMQLMKAKSAMGDDSHHSGRHMPMPNSSAALFAAGMNPYGAAGGFLQGGEDQGNLMY